MCHISLVKCHILNKVKQYLKTKTIFKKKWQKGRERKLENVVELVDGGSVINGVTPSILVSESFILLGNCTIVKLDYCSAVQ